MAYYIILIQNPLIWEKALVEQQHDEMNTTFEFLWTFDFLEFMPRLIEVELIIWDGFRNVTGLLYKLIFQVFTKKGKKPV